MSEASSKRDPQNDTAQPRGQSQQHSEETNSLLQDLQDELDAANRQLEAQAATSTADRSGGLQSWVRRVNQVQADLERSKVTVRAIVQQAEAHKTSELAVVDCSRKVDLLEQELEFNEALVAALDHIQTLYQKLDQVRALVVQGKTVSAAQSLQHVKHDLATARTSLPPNVVHALEARTRDISDALADTVRDHISKAFRVTIDPPAIKLTAGKQEEATLADYVDILGELEGLAKITKAWKIHLEEAFFSHWAGITSSEAVPQVQKIPEGLSTVAQTEHATTSFILDQVSVLVKFVSESLPQSATSILSAAIMPQFLDHFETQRFLPNIPLHADSLTKIDDTIKSIGNLARTLENCSWDGHEKAAGWVDKLPSLWLARQRENVLDLTRKCLLEHLSERKQVERVETEVVDTGSDAVPEPQKESNGWDTEWNDGPEQEVNGASRDETDDDASAWETGDDDEDASTEATTAVDHAEEAGEDADEAWGWGDGNDIEANNGMKGGPQPTTKKEEGSGAQVLTLREAYTATGVPGRILDLCITSWREAHTLANSSAAKSAIGAGSPALWNVPPLGMALYRAMALAAYDKLDFGRLLLYNDSSWIAEQTNAIASGSHDGVQGIDFTNTVLRKLRQEAAAFERSAKTAYGAEMESQRTILRDLLDGAQGFSNCTTSPFAEECDDAVAMALDRLRDVHGQWQPILSKSALLQSIGSLLSTVISKFIMDIEDLSDIGEDESKRLLSYCKSICSISGIFTETNPDTAETRDMTALYCINWLKLQYLGEVLDGNLADIKYLWKEGELSMEFDADEVADLIRALFADSDHRRRAISEISKS